MELALLIYAIDVIAVDKVGYGVGIIFGVALLVLSVVIFGIQTDGWDRSVNYAYVKNGLRVWDTCKKYIVGGIDLTDILWLIHSYHPVKRDCI